MTDPRLFTGRRTIYALKITNDQGEAARNDPLGFYRAMTAKHGDKDFVLVGPSSNFVPAAKYESQQLSFF